MNSFGDMRENRILTLPHFLPHFLPQRVKGVNFYGVTFYPWILAVTYMKSVAVQVAIF